MTDIFSKPFIYIFGMLLTAYVAVIYLAKMDNMLQSYCDDQVYNFVDESCTAGYISPESYIEMVEKINNTGNLYDIKIMHSSKVSHPYQDPDNAQEQTEDEYTNTYHFYDKDDILSNMFPQAGTNKRYSLKHGDQLKVTVSLKEPTLAARLYSLISKKQIKTIFSTYGRTVGNTSDTLFY